MRMRFCTHTHAHMRTHTHAHTRTYAHIRARAQNRRAFFCMRFCALFFAKSLAKYFFLCNHACMHIKTIDFYKTQKAHCTSGCACFCAIMHMHMRMQSCMQLCMCFLCACNRTIMQAHAITCMHTIDCVKNNKKKQKKRKNHGKNILYKIAKY